MTDDSLKGTPNRVAKMFVKEIFGGLHPDRKPKASTFDNKYKYGEMLVEKNIVLSGDEYRRCCLCDRCKAFMRE